VINPLRDQPNVPGRRHPPPVPVFSRLLPGEAGIALEDFLRHLRDEFSGEPAPHTHPGLPAVGSVPGVSGEEAAAIAFFLGGC